MYVRKLEDKEAQVNVIYNTAISCCNRPIYLQRDGLFIQCFHAAWRRIVSSEISITCQQ